MSCTRCNRTLAKQAVVNTRAGGMCKRCAGRLPSYLHRPPRPVATGKGGVVMTNPTNNT